MDKLPMGLNETEWKAIQGDSINTPSTINDYRKVLNLLHSYENGKYHISTMSKEDCKEYFTYLDSRKDVSGKGSLSASTIHRYKSTLRSIGYKMEKRKDIFPSFQNGFANMEKESTWKKSDFTLRRIPTEEEMHAFLQAVKEFTLQEQAMIYLSLFLGLTPYDLQHMKFSDFSIDNESTVPQLHYRYYAGTFMDSSDLTTQKETYENPIYDVKLDHIAQSKKVTWKYWGHFIFSPSFTSFLFKMNPTFKTCDKDDFVFKTTHNRPYSYRTINHLCCRINDRAGLDKNALTPGSLSFIGTIKSYILHSYLREEEVLESILNANTIPTARKNIETQLSAHKARIKRFTQTGWIGTYTTCYPIPKKNFVKAVEKQIGIDKIIQIAQLF